MTSTLESPALDYRRFVESKSQVGSAHGFEPLWMPDFLFDFQASLVEWALRKGRAAIFADTGLGKTAMQLVWASNVARKANRPVLVLTPLAVAQQTAREGEKFGIECERSKDGNFSGKSVVVANYERLHYFNPKHFAGVVCDESSCIKAFDGKRRKQVTRFLSSVPYRLLCTATAAPNDFIELGTAAEALGELSQSEMLSLFFRSSDNMRHSLFKEGDFWNRAKWFFRPHAELPFWRWVCTWARAIRRPEDLGFDGTRFILPALNVRQRVVGGPYTPPGELFPRVARTLKEQREERKRTIRERCESVVELVSHDRPAVVWCQYNAEGDLLEKIIPGSVQVAGCDSDEVKEERLEAFTTGKARVLVTKPKVGAWGLNWQHCGHHTFFPSHSFEQFYQAVRRSWRFGRTEPIDVDVIATPGEEGVTANLQAKQDKAAHMFEAMVREMVSASRVERPDNHIRTLEAPPWL